MTNKLYDVVVIGCGVVGAAVAYELSKHNLKVAAIDKEQDVAEGTTKANSAIVHAGFDPEPGTLMARLNVHGAEMMQGLCEKLSVSYKKNGAFVLAFNDEDERMLKVLMDQGEKNKVRKLELLSAESARKLEPNISSEVKSVLFAEDSAIIEPWDLCIALSDTAKRNGVEFFLASELMGACKEGDEYLLTTGLGQLRTRFVVNAAGTYSDVVHSMFAPRDFEIVPVKGEYHLLDKNQGNLVIRTIFQCPGKAGKGVLVSPTVHGNLIAGPSAQRVSDPRDVATTKEGLEGVRRMALRSVPGIDFKQEIRSFAGMRANSSEPDFIIREIESGVIDLAGIRSPGLTAAPAIAEECLKLLEKAGLELEPKKDFKDGRFKVRFAELSEEEQTLLIAKNPAYGKVVCRCECITEGELIDAISSPIPPRTLDAIKKRTGAGLGRCQGGFCGPRTVELISKTLGIPHEEILLNKKNSNILK